MIPDSPPMCSFQTQIGRLRRSLRTNSRQTLGRRRMNFLSCYPGDIMCFLSVRIGIVVSGREQLFAWHLPRRQRQHHFPFHAFAFPFTPTHQFHSTSIPTSKIITLRGHFRDRIDYNLCKFFRIQLIDWMLAIR